MTRGHKLTSRIVSHWETPSPELRQTQEGAVPETARPVPPAAAPRMSTMPTETLSGIDSLLRSLQSPESAEAPAAPAPSPEPRAATPPPAAEAPAATERRSAVVPQMPSAPQPRPPRPTAPKPRVTVPPAESSSRKPNSRGYFPPAPTTIEEAGLHYSEITDIALKFLLHHGTESGYRLSLHLGLRFGLVESLLRQLKVDRLVLFKSSVAGGDYIYELTDLGRERARGLTQRSTYFGAAPVPLKQYEAGVAAQTLTGRKPTLEKIREALDELAISPRLLSSIGQAIHSGRGMFLFGPPGNGKTSIAERITRAFGDTIWIPKAITAGGEIVRVFDPNRHKVVPIDESESADIDGRWLRIERPTIIAGGELCMENLEISYIHTTGVGEAPLQMKANCGTLLIDDFGRQRMPVDELLNRWIVPLEQRHDFLRLESGRTIQVPFDQLIIFSSNLEPRDLVDDAFLRRIPYKIEVGSPSPDEFRDLFLKLSAKMDFECDPAVLEHLLSEHYAAKQRPFRFCHARDLLWQIENYCSLHNAPRVVTHEAIEMAVENYFAVF